MIRKINLVYEYDSPLGPILPILDSEDMPELFLSILNDFSNLENQLVKANKSDYKGVESYYSHLLNLFSHYIQKYVHNPEKMILDYVHLTDVQDKEDELYFLMIQSCHFYTIEREISKNYLNLDSLSSFTIKMLKENKNFFLWIVDDKEGSYEFTTEFSDNILSFLTKHNIDSNKIIFSNCNNFISKKIDFIKSFPVNPYILQGSLDTNIDFNGYTKTAPTIEDVYNLSDRLRPLKFLSYNRNSSRLHRLLLVSRLYKDDIIENCKVSLYENEYFNDISRDDLFYTFEGLTFTYVDLAWMKKTLKEIYPLHLDFDNQQTTAQSDNFLSEKSHYLDTYFSLVTETSISNEWCFVTEKCIRPMIGMHPFIVFGNPHTLKVLKEFGFKTFNKIIDESYDDEFDTNKRFEMAYDEVKKLNNLPKEELHGLYYSIIDILNHNKNLVKKLALTDAVVEDMLINLQTCITK